MTRLPRLVLLTSTLAILSGCVAAGNFCDTARPIRPLVSDSLDYSTKSQILAHNEYGQRACGWRP